MQPFSRSEMILGPVREFLRANMAAGLTRAQAKAQYRRMRDQEVYINDTYQVNVTRDIQFPGMAVPLTHLSIKRRDKEVLHDWRELQAIKNLICGKEREAVELYPADSRLVDTANQYHLWVLPEGMTFPFGYSQREVSSKPLMEGSKQRPIEP